MDVLMAYCDNTTAGIFCRRRRRRRLALPCHGVIYHCLGYNPDPDQYGLSLIGPEMAWAADGINEWVEFRPNPQTLQRHTCSGGYIRVLRPIPASSRGLCAVTCVYYRLDTRISFQRGDTSSYPGVDSVLCNVPKASPH